MRALVLTMDAFGGHGGIAQYNRDFLNALCAHPRFSEVVAIPRLMPNPPETLPSNLRYVTGGLSSKLRYIATTLNTVRKDLRYDLIVCGHTNLLPIAYFVSSIMRAPVLLMIYGIDAWPEAATSLKRRLVPGISAFISISQFTAKRFRSWAGVDDIEGFLLPNCVNLNLFTPGLKSAALLKRYGLTGKTVLMTLGRLVGNERYKGFDEVLELMPVLVKEIPNVAYLIAGDGTDRERLEAKAKSLGVNGSVVFAGYVPEAEKVEHYRLADAYVMPSRGEGFGFVFLEAMACGVPVVASKADGSREAVLDGQLGILVDPSNPDEIKAGIYEALQRPSGVVPAGLRYFSCLKFKERCHGILDHVLERGSRRG